MLLILLAAFLLVVRRYISTPIASSQRGSVFADDICNPPCWFGLTPGESTSTDVEANLLRFENIFTWNSGFRNNTFDQQGYVLNGQYSVYWRNIERDDVFSTESYISIENSVVSRITVEMNMYVYLTQMLETLGPPSETRLAVGIYNIPYLELIYLDSQMRVSLIGNPESCSLLDIGTDFWVDFVRYYPPDENSGHSSNLLTYSQEPEERAMSLELWRQWLNGEINLTCLEAWQTLPQQTIIPTSTD